jgi:hypothetical protein
MVRKRIVATLRRDREERFVGAQLPQVIPCFARVGQLWRTS